MRKPVQVQITVAVPAAVLADASGLREMVADAISSLPGARARFDARVSTARDQRAAARRLSLPADLDLAALLDRMGWSREYAEHLVQPYCTCGPDRDDGWYVCLHAEDLGLRS